MRNNDNNLIISRNETFTMDRVVQNRDGSPYIVSSQLNNPHILITVSSSKYRQANRYLKRFYLPLEKVPRFYYTNPINIKSLSQSLLDGPYTDFPECQLSTDPATGKLVFMSAYYEGNYVSFEVNDAVFYRENDDGTISYKYWSPDVNVAGNGGKWVDYEFRFVRTFDSDFTSKLVEQTYYYCIELVAGQIDVENDVIFYDYVAPLLDNRTISVMSNLKGGML